MKKRVLAIGLALSMAMATLTGCNLGKAPETQVTNDTLQIGIVAKGYGDEFAKQLAAAFQEKTGIKTEVVKSQW